MAEFGGRELTAEAILKLVDKTGEGLRSAEKNLAGTQQRMIAMSKRMAVIGASLTAGVTLPILAWAKHMTMAQIEEERQLIRVRIHLQAVGKQTGFTTAQLEKMARRLADNKNSVDDFGDVMSQNIDVLAKFGTLHGKTFERAAQLVEDVNAVTREGLEATAQKIGKVLADPVASMKVLKDMGVTLSAEQKKQIRDLEKNGQRATVVAYVLRRLEKAWHDQSRGLAKSTAGQIMLIGKNMEEFGKDVNKTTLEWVDPAIRRVRKWSESLKEMTPEQKKLTAQVLAVAAAAGPALLGLSLVTAAVTKIGTAVGVIWRRFPQLLLIGSAVKSVADHWDEVSASMGKAGDQFDKGNIGKGIDELGRSANTVFQGMLLQIPGVGKEFAQLSVDVNQAFKDMGVSFENWGAATEREIRGIMNAVAAASRAVREADNWIRGRGYRGKGVSTDRINIRKAEQDFMKPLPLPGMDQTMPKEPPAYFKGALDELAAAAKRASDNLKLIPDFKPQPGLSANVPPPPRPGGLGSLIKRALGGAASGWTVTGERGPELKYEGPGWIHSADKLQAIMAMLARTQAQAIRPNTQLVSLQREQTEKVARPLERVSMGLERLTILLERFLAGGVSRGTGTGGGAGAGPVYGGPGGYRGPASTWGAQQAAVRQARQGTLGWGGEVGAPRSGGAGSALTYPGIDRRAAPTGHHPAMAGPGTTGPVPETGPSAKAGTYRQPYKLGAADIDRRVINTIAGEAIVRNRASVDAVVNNMLNRVGTKGAWGPDKNLLQVARAPGQYAGYRPASDKEAAFIRSRIEAVSSGTEPDPTSGANTYRAAGYGSVGTSKWFRKYGQYGKVVGGNRYAYDPAGGRGPYSPYDEATVARNLANARASAAASDSAAAERRGIGKGSLDVNLRINGPARVEKVRTTPPENLEISTGIDNTGARFHRPGGQIGPV